MLLLNQLSCFLIDVAGLFSQWLFSRVHSLVSRLRCKDRKGTNYVPEYSCLMAFTSCSKMAGVSYMSHFISVRPVPVTEIPQVVLYSTGCLYLWTGIAYTVAEGLTDS